MAKQSGAGSALWFGSVDLSGDVGAITGAETTRAALPITGIDKSAEERTTGLRDGTLGFTAYWNTAAGGAHLSLLTHPTTDVQVSAAIGTPAVGTAACSILAKQTNYAVARGADGSLVATINAVGNGYALEWGELLTTGKQTFASGTVNGASIDVGAVSTLFGAAAYLHVFSIGSGNPTVTIKDSADNGTFAALAPTSLVFTPTVAGVNHLVTGLAATIRRYIRVEVTGTYTNLVAAVIFVRYTESMAV